MKGSVNNQLETIEKQWLTRLFSHCKHIFEGFHIPSHDHWHHLRTWHHAKGLITNMPATSPLKKEKILQILISCMLHDTGLTITLSEKHGEESAIIAKKYREGIEEFDQTFWETIFEAIKHHDNKDYKGDIYKSDKLPTSVLHILCVADDLDAFGLIGAFRYTEIYTLRNIPNNQLAEKVLENLEKRFSNFSALYKSLHTYYSCHKKRFLTCKTLFTDLLNRESYAIEIISLFKDISNNQEKRLEHLHEDTTAVVNKLLPKGKKTILKLTKELKNFSLNKELY